MGGKFGAMQYSFLPPHFKCSGCNTKSFDKTEEEAKDSCNCTNPVPMPKEGTVFVEACSPKEKNQYDWDNKISMALTPDDMGKFLTAFRTGREMKILHDPGAGSPRAGQIYKTIYFSSPNGIMAENGGGIFKFSQKGSDTERTHTIPASTSEIMVLMTLLTQAISGVLGWK